jgi:Tol biopolymer transport system component
MDVFVRDLKRRVTKRIGGRAYDYGETYAPEISGNGRFVAFLSAAFVSGQPAPSYREGLFRRDLKTGATEQVDLDPGGAEGNGSSFPFSLSGDGRIVVFNSFASNLVPGDSNLKKDVFIRDLANHTTTRVSVDSAGQQAATRSDAPAISADGRFAGFHSTAALVPGDTNGKRDVFVRGPLN